MKTHEPHAHHTATQWSRIYPRLLWVGLALAVGWLIYKHNTHVLYMLPFLFLLACPLVHIVGHGEHSHSPGPTDAPSESSDKQAERPSQDEQGRHHH